jgi:hypothetical protein
MPLTHDQVAAIGADVVRQFSEPLKFIGVMASRGGSTRVEVIVAVTGCHNEPCRFLWTCRDGTAQRSNQIFGPRSSVSCRTITP